MGERRVPGGAEEGGAAHGVPTSMSGHAQENTTRQVSQPFLLLLNLIFTFTSYGIQCRGRIVGRNWDDSLKNFPPCYSQSTLLMDFTPPPPCKRKPQDYDYKPLRNCTFMNSASVLTAKYVQRV